MPITLHPRLAEKAQTLPDGTYKLCDSPLTYLISCQTVDCAANISFSTDAVPQGHGWTKFLGAPRCPACTQAALI